MPRTKTFNKRKGFFCGISGNKKAKANESRPRPSCSSEGSVNDISNRISSSKKKIEGSVEEYTRYENNTHENDCYDIVNIKNLSKLLSEIAVCVKCGSTLSLNTSNRVGLSVNIDVTCNEPSCSYKVSSNNSEKLVSGKYEINVRTMYAFRCIGKGEQAAQTFCALMDLPTPPSLKRYRSLLHTATKVVCENTMKKAAEECVEENDQNRDVTAIFDGSWQRRGHTSLNGVVTAIAANIGKVVDVRVYSKYCRCKKRLKNEHENNCAANYTGSSGGMEVAGVLDMFRQSETTRDIRYKFYLGDGDSAAYPSVVKQDPYGAECKVEKLECLGHVKKRMGSRLKKLKSNLGNTKLEDGKTIGGQHRLTIAMISEIQEYYGLAIIRNTDSLDNMKRAIWATYFHLSSTNEKPAHELCPKGSDSWCKFQRAAVTMEPYDHNKHTHLSSIVMQQIKPIFRDLSNPELLKRCLHRGTQNANESLNNLIWTRIPKNIFVMKETLELGVYEAVASYNTGNLARLDILDNLGICPGQQCVRTMKKLDEVRVKKAEKSIQELEIKCRKNLTMAKKRLEDQYEQQEGPDNPSYGPGMY